MCAYFIKLIKCGTNGVDIYCNHNVVLKMRIAVCVVGHARTFGLLAVRSNLLRISPRAALIIIHGGGLKRHSH